jgi:hypothetical protein
MTLASLCEGALDHLFTSSGPRITPNSTHAPARGIPGASTGIGKAAALELAAKGYTVYAGVRQRADVDAFAKLTKVDVTGILLDVTNQASADSCTTTLRTCIFVWNRNKQSSP